MIIEIRITFEDDYDHSRTQDTINHILILIRQVLGIKRVTLGKVDFKNDNS